MNPPGLIHRRTFPIDRGRWVMEEKWDISVPGCPMIRSPWQPPPLHQGNIYIRQVEMTAEEHAAAMAAARASPKPR